MRRIAWFLVIACIATAAWADEEEARVLVLNGLDTYSPSYQAADAAMRANLAEETTRRIVLYSEHLDAGRFPEKTLEPQILALLSNKYRMLQIDVVVAVGKAGVEFFERHGEQLWPGARLVFYGFLEDTDLSALPPNAIGQVMRTDVGGTLDLARRLQPNARRILVISGAAPIDVQLEQRARRVLPTTAGDAAVEFLSGWPQPELVNRLAREPADTIVLFLSQWGDRDGRPYVPREVLRAISKASAAPVYGMYEPLVGFGAAAGSTEYLEAGGKLVGQQVRDAIAGRSPEPGKAVLTAPSRCVADARQLHRWSLDERRLPDGCDIRFADRPLWRQYWWQIALTLAVIAAQALLIAALLVQRRRRRVAEAESRERFAEMAHMNRRVAMGGLAASIAHELNQPLGAIHNNAGAAQIMIKADPPNLSEVAEILDDIKKDDKRASEVIARIRTMLRKTSVNVEEVYLNEIVGDTMKLLAADASEKRVQLTAELEPGLPLVRADKVQVQQVLLNLALNAIEAMGGQPEGKRQLLIRTRAANEKDAEVSVIDSGPGIDGALLPHIFDAFVTSKSGGMGLGLSISQTIIEAHGGRIHAENLPEGGAAFHVTLPFATAGRAR